MLTCTVCALQPNEAVERKDGRPCGGFLHYTHLDHPPLYPRTCKPVKEHRICDRPIHVLTVPTSSKGPSPNPYKGRGARTQLWGHCFLEDSEREEHNVDPKREGQEGGVHVAQITINSYQPCPKAIFSLKLILHKPQSAHTLSKDSTMPAASPNTSLRPQPQSPPGHLPTPLCP